MALILAVKLQNPKAPTLLRNKLVVPDLLEAAAHDRVIIDDEDASTADHDAVAFLAIFHGATAR
jgi:hypothetical protein